MIQVNDTHEGNFRLLGFLIKKSKFTIDLSLKVSSAKKTIFCHVVDVNVPWTFFLCEEKYFVLKISRFFHLPWFH